MISRKNPYDVLVFGSGGGGLRAAIGAAMEGQRVLVVSRGKINRSGATLLAGANISADIACDGATLSRLGISDLKKDDTKEGWKEELLKEGFYLNNEKLIALFAETAGDRVEELISWGLQVRGLEGEREISVFGSDILDTLYKKAKELGVSFLEDTALLELVRHEDGIAGAVCLELLEGELLFYPAKAVVLATGGAHNVFRHNSGGTDLCGEGQAVALRAGAELLGMEMISFCPTVTLVPEMYEGNILPYILLSTGYGTLLNRFGKPFTHKYLTHKVEKLALETEWNKMLLSYAIQQEIMAGNGTREGGVYFHLDLNPKEIMENLYRELPALDQGIYKKLMGVFRDGRAFVVAPAAHYFEGGIRINERMETKINGLYAAGECTGGMFGANRVSAATTEMLVEGAVAGREAAGYAASARKAPGYASSAGGQADPGADTFEKELERIEKKFTEPFGITEGLRPSQVKCHLQELMSRSMGVIRDGEDLDAAWAELCRMESEDCKKICIISKNRAYNREWMDFLELKSMLLCAKAMVQSALVRQESRGVHIRKDFPYTDDGGFLKEIVISNENMDYYFVEKKMEKDWPAGSVKQIPYAEAIERTVESLK